MATMAKVLKQLIQLGRQLGYQGEQLPRCVKDEKEAAENAVERE